MTPELTLLILGLTLIAIPVCINVINLYRRISR